MAGEEGIMIAFVLVIAIFLFAIGFLISILNRTKRERTLNYRKNVLDFIVVGKMRQYADEHKVDINKEHLLYKKFCENDKIGKKELDYQIEEQLIKEVEEQKK